MARRPRADDDVEELLADVPHLWQSHGPNGQEGQKANRAVVELLYRWGYLNDVVFEETDRPHWLWYTHEQMQVATIAIEAEQRGLDHELTLNSLEMLDVG
jgi:hypothetical protein